MTVVKVNPESEAVDSQSEKIEIKNDQLVKVFKSLFPLRSN